jgi:hypothetical protein
MNRPRLPIRTATMRPVAVHHALIHLCQQVPGPALVSTLSLTQEQTGRARLRAFCGLLVKNARISLFNVICTKVFTFSPSKVLTERNIRSRNVKSSGVQTTKTGGRRPHFFGFQPPKKFFGVAPARWFRRATSHRRDAPPAGLPLTYSVAAHDTGTGTAQTL